jgi:hypothetical protein
MAAACLIIVSSLVGQLQFTHYYARGPGYGYGGYGGYYGRTPLPLYDPIRYARYYSGSGFYTYAPPAIANPRVIVPFKSVMSLPGITGRVVGLDERRKLITLRLPAESIEVPFGPFTKFRAADGSFPEITPGMLINVNHNMVTVLARGQP